jgi:cytochrome o ubiquinol oxidase operon protein cyoD
MIDRNHGWIVSYKPVILGFFLSFILTYAMFRAVDREHLSGNLFVISLFSLAILQTIIQLVLFLQIGLESKPHWASISLLFTIMIILIIIGGSIWIMNNLSYNLMPMTKPMPTHGAF